MKNIMAGRQKARKKRGDEDKIKSAGKAVKKMGSPSKSQGERDGNGVETI